jgi:serine/threonine protein kinase
MIAFTCSACRRTIRVPDALAGKKGKCPGCATIVQVPDEPTSRSTAPTRSLASSGEARSREETLAPEEVPPAPAPSSVQIPGYEVLSEVGRGGMGVVYKARQLRPRRLVALKVVLSGQHASAEALARFHAEAEAIARLSHPNIVQVHAVGAHAGQPFFTLEYIDGGTLAQTLASRRLEPSEAAGLVHQLARAVQYAHQRGVIHRDLKPGNILLASPALASPARQGREKTPPGANASAPAAALAECIPKIADFGLAKQLDDLTSVTPAAPRTASGAVMGTPCYMAPEQAGGKTREVGPASDVYALGAILYETLTQRPPFQATSALDTLMKVATEEPTPPRKLRPQVPLDLETICLKCLRKDPKKRYATAQALAEDLRRFLDGKPVQARPQGKLERVGRWLKKRKEFAYLAGGALLAVCLSLVVLTFWRGRAGTPAVPVPVSTLEPDDLPADLRLVPRDAFAFASVRVGALWARKDLAKLVEDMLPRPGLPPGQGLDGIGLQMEKAVSIHPRDVERVTVVQQANPLEGPRNFDQTTLPALVVCTSKPYEFRKVRSGFEKLFGGLVRRPHDRWMIYTSAKGNGAALCPVSDRVLMAGRAQELRALLSRSEKSQSRGPLSDPLALAGRGKLVVLGVRSPGKVMRELEKFQPKGPGQPVFNHPFTDVERWIFALDLPPARSDGFLPGFDLDQSLLYPDEERAAKGAITNQAPLMAWLAQPLGAAPAMPRGLEEIFKRITQGTKMRQEGREVHQHLRVRWTPGDLVQLQAAFKAVAQGQMSVEKLKQIGLALHNYHAAHGRFPPAVVTSPLGQPLWSWRVELLPYLQENIRFQQLRRDRPWDDPANKKLLEKVPAVFAAFGDTAGPDRTYYQAIVGPGAGFEGKVGLRLPADFPDGTSSTLLVVEAAKPVHWAAPADLTFVPGKSPRVGEHLRKGFHGLLADGTARFFPATIDPKVLDALCTRAGGERIDMGTLHLLLPPPKGVQPPDR